jgi:HPt (histidine-containing phosphotransfer) domain-containing protein
MHATCIAFTQRQCQDVSATNAMSSPSAWRLPDELRQLAEQGASEVVDEILDVFRSDTVKRLAKAHEALASGDRAELKRQAHAIKGSAGQVGAPAVAAICQSLELRAPAATTGELDEMLRDLDVRFAEVLRDMNAADPR